MTDALRIAAIVFLLLGVTASRGHAQTAPAQPAPNRHRLWQDEIVYVIVVQKFFNGDTANDIMLRRYGAERSRYEGGYWGGDLAGIIQKLDYLQSLGVTTLLLYPVMANDANPQLKYLPMGYRPRDYFHVDENFGDLALLRRLVAGAHQRNMRVLLDLPLGMPGFEHPYNLDPRKQDWFGPYTPYGIRQWNTDQPQVADYLIKVSKFWKEQSGCDGFRLDSAHLHSDRFWRAYATELKRGSDDFILLAEVPLGPKRIDDFLKATGVDSAYDFALGVVRDVFGKGASAAKLSFEIHNDQKCYSAPQRMCALIDSYEDPAFMDVAKEPKEARMKLAMTMLLTLNRVPMLYCGDEVATSFRNVGELFKPAHQASPLLNYTKQLIALRKQEEALLRGNLTELLATKTVYAFARTSGSAQVVVILNNSGQAERVSFKIGAKPWRSVALKDLLSQREVKARHTNEPLEVEPWGARILKVGD